MIIWQVKKPCMPDIHLISRHAHLFMSRAPPNILGILQPIGLKFGVSLPVPKPSSRTKFEPNWLGSFGEMDWKPIYVIKSINWSFLRNYPTDLAQILCASRVRIRASADKISAQSLEGHQRYWVVRVTSKKLVHHEIHSNIFHWRQKGLIIPVSSH